MAQPRTRALSEVLDQLENAVDGDSTSVRDVVEQLGRKSFASLMLVFSLKSKSPASAILGVTAGGGARLYSGNPDDHWKKDGMATRVRGPETPLDRQTLQGVRWLRRPVHFVERFLKPRFTILLHRPWIFYRSFLYLR
ncbi:exopolysaccharide biosynthesis protein [Qipengyuania sp. DY56-A-20]|jgi:hypothetical protein|uniref:Exopolysaccharide biosynthesis protein n=1 Tax=Qipengyuania benthica TaxID=3067651 RepID=A0ABT9HC31_9SPHN|nr:exopolysaccharide biosynthesis protein [Qipengyuania sp. DY56-A-20]MDP4540821.1 exopolysaccharide biosynthesis protein [Qipengyuania sp. DY56-A-20]